MILSHLGFSLPLSDGMERLLTEQLAGEQAGRREQVLSLSNGEDIIKPDIMISLGSQLPDTLTLTFPGVGMPRCWVGRGSEKPLVGFSKEQSTQRDRPSSKQLL